MIFKEAYEALKQGAMIKLPEWAGYWKWEDNSIKMHCKNGTVLDIRETEDIDYTLKFMMRDDWEIVGEANVRDLNIQTFTFGEAVRNLKAGKKVARKGWNGKGMFCLYVPSEKWGIVDKIGLDIPKENLLPWIGMKTADNKFVPWLASQADMLATDWVIVE